MARLLDSTTLLPPEDAGGGVDPMSGLGNLMDVMLVFACGLILALVTHYNVQLVTQDADAGSSQAGDTSLEEMGSVEKLDAELTAGQEGASASGDEFAEVGTVYRDVNTGELYVVTPDRQ